MSIASRLACFPLAALTLAASLAAPATASACWDGVAFDTDRLTVSMATDLQAAEWTPERARNYAKWAGRLHALVPEGKTLDVEFGYIHLCDVVADTCEELDVTWNENYLSNLFEIVADATGVSDAQVMAARRSHMQPLTVQVAASSDLEAAESLAHDINEEMIGVKGFLEIGGFPAINDDAHVVESWKGDAPTYHVVVGSFLDREAANAAASTLKHDLGLRGFVRTLDQDSVDSVGC